MNNRDLVSNAITDAIKYLKFRPIMYRSKTLKLINTPCMYKIQHIIGGVLC